MEDFLFATKYTNDLKNKFKKKKRHKKTPQIGAF